MKNSKRFEELWHEKKDDKRRKIGKKILSAVANS